MTAELADGDELPCLAAYRDHASIEKAYGSWLALERMPEHVAS